MHSNTIQRARDKARSGAAVEAMALLRSAHDAGNPDAAAELAFWFLRGDVVSRDVPEARKLLREAVRLGHAEATLLEIALCANGSGEAADWTTALALLWNTAKSEPWLQRELNIIDRLALDGHGYPESLPPAELIDERLPIFRYRNFLSTDEREHFASVALGMLEPSTVFDPKTGRQVTHPIRNSDGAIIGLTQESLVIQAINRRIARATETTLAQGEPFSVLRYRPGQEYKLHYDAIHGETNNRIKTDLLYLNDGYLGGQTAFPDLDVIITPRAGDAIIFDGLNADGSVNPVSRHAGLPVQRGTKWLATRWIRADAFDPWTINGSP